MCTPPAVSMARSADNARFEPNGTSTASDAHHRMLGAHGRMRAGETQQRQELHGHRAQRHSSGGSSQPDAWPATPVDADDSDWPGGRGAGAMRYGGAHQWRHSGHDVNAASDGPNGSTGATWKDQNGSAGTYAALRHNVMLCLAKSLVGHVFCIA